MVGEPVSDERSNFFVAGAAAMTSNREDWETPQSLFDALDAEHHFTLDPCSTHENAKCEKHYTKEDDGLSKSWGGEVVFCNPPYGKEIGDWCAKCALEAIHGTEIVLLIPSRTDTRYFHDYLYRNPLARLEFIKGRLKFEQGGESLASAPFRSLLVFLHC